MTNTTVGSATALRRCRATVLISRYKDPLARALSSVFPSFSLLSPLLVLELTMLASVLISAVIALGAGEHTDAYPNRVRD